MAPKWSKVASNGPFRTSVQKIENSRGFWLLSPISFLKGAKIVVGPNRVILGPGTRLDGKKWLIFDTVLDRFLTILTLLGLPGQQMLPATYVANRTASISGPNMVLSTLKEYF